MEDSIFDSQVTQLDVWEPEQWRILTSKGVSGVLRRTCHIKGFKLNWTTMEILGAQFYM